MTPIRLILIFVWVLSIYSGMELNLKKVQTIAPLNEIESDVCDVCKNQISHPTEKFEPSCCVHKFHKDCMTPLLCQEKRGMCPLCRKQISEGDVHLKFDEIRMLEDRHSTAVKPSKGLKKICKSLQRPLLLTLILSYHFITGFLLTGMSLMHAILWPWYFVFLILLNRIVHRARFNYLCNQYRNFGIKPGVVNTKYRYQHRWYFLWFLFSIMLVVTTIVIPRRVPHDTFGEAMRFFGEGSEALNLFYNFAICLLGFHASAFLLFVTSKCSKRIRKWASYTEAKIITVFVRVLFIHHLMYALWTGWTLFYFIFCIWVVILTVVSVNVYKSYSSLNFLNL